MEDQDHGLWQPAVVVWHVGASFILEIKSVEESFVWSFVMSCLYVSLNLNKYYMLIGF